MAAWGWGGVAINQRQDGITLKLGGQRRRLSRTRRCDGTFLVQGGGYEPWIIEFPAVLDGVTRSALKTAANGGPHTLTGPDGESFANMELLPGDWELVINVSGLRVVQLRFEGDG